MFRLFSPRLLLTARQRLAVFTPEESFQRGHILRILKEAEAGVPLAQQRRLKKIVAQQALDIDALKVALSKKW